MSLSTLSSLVQKIEQRLKFWKIMSKSKVTMSKVLVPDKWTGHDSSIFEILKPCLFGSIDIANVQVLEK